MNWSRVGLSIVAGALGFGIWRLLRAQACTHRYKRLRWVLRFEKDGAGWGYYKRLKCESCGALFIYGTVPLLEETRILLGGAGNEA